MSIESKVLQAVAKISKRKVDDVALESKFDQLGMDSLDRLCLVHELEEIFDIDIEEDDVKNVDTVGGIVAALSKNGGGAQAAAGTSS